MLGDNKVCLNVSDEYLAFLQENGVDSLIDFGWLKNAFVVDYLAEVMIARGYTLGAITSYDGYTRNFDSLNTEYAFNVFAEWPLWFRFVYFNRGTTWQFCFFNVFEHLLCSLH